MNGTSTAIPHSPNTTLGTTATSSTSIDSAGRILPGTASERKIAAPTLSGTAIRIAIAELSKVPTMKTAMP